MSPMLVDKKLLQGAAAKRTSDTSSPGSTTLPTTALVPKVILKEWVNLMATYQVDDPLLKVLMVDTPPTPLKDKSKAIVSNMAEEKNNVTLDLFANRMSVPSTMWNS
ncbi:unnamed protein product, partial [Ilex paraguariensis]